MPRLLVSAAHKSSGKTMVSLGLAAACRRRGRDTRSFKKGPDYIDALWLARASGNPCYNLDFNTQTPEEIRATFVRGATGGDIALVEGNKGLHDGVDVEGADSTAALARLLDAPVLLVLDTTGITRGVAALLYGMERFDPGLRFAGVVLNQVATARQESKLRQAIERYSDLPVLGAIGRAPAMIIKERHLGLMTPGDSLGPEERIGRIREVVEAGVDVDRLLGIAGRLAPASPPPPPAPVAARAKDLMVAVARDDAFCFYYQDDLDALERSGAQLVFFSPLADQRLPAADAILLGGGFPESHVRALAANAPMRTAIRAAATRGVPVYAECGGLMYLCRSISWRGETGEMAGVVPAEAVMQERAQGRGLVVLQDTPAAPWPVGAAAGADSYPAHEFHFARLENLDPSASFGRAVLRGQGIDGNNDAVALGATVAGFCHLRDTSRCRWVEGFLDFVRRRKTAATVA